MDQTYVKMRKISNCIPHLTFALLFCSTFLEITANDSGISEQPNSTSPTTTVSIDLSQCTCTSQEMPCDLSIIKSSLLEIGCLIGENMCCPMVKTSDSTSDTKNQTTNSNEAEVNTSMTTNGNVKIYQIKPMADLDLSNTSDQIILGKPKPKKNCHCKARSSCPHKYIDYGFGFHCTYNTVRCCIPEDEIVDKVDKQNLVTMNITGEMNTLATTATNETDTGKENDIDPRSSVSEPAMDATSNLQPVTLTVNDMATSETQSSAMIPNSDNAAAVNEQLQGNGELLITEVTNLWKYDDTEKDGDCFCLPIQKCRVRLESNNIERRRDTLCPGDSIQCCGGDVLEEITKKRDDADVDMAHIKTEYPPYHQPIQLPGTINTETEGNETETPEISPVPISPTLPPPQLPTQYHSYEPNNYNRGYNYPPNSYPGQLSGPQSYQKGMYGSNGQNIRPWVSLSSPSTYSKYPPPVRNEHQGYPRGPYPNESRASKPGGLFDTLASILG